MAEFRLAPRPALGRLHEEIGATTLTEVDGARLTTVSIPLDGHEAMDAAVEDHFGCALPTPGNSALSKTTGARILRLGHDRLMLLQLPEAAAALPDLPGYGVDQSDYWAMVELAGPLCIASLERTCRLDLDISAFAQDAFARTPMEGVSTILLRLEPARFLLMAPRSYAQSFAHTLITSLTYVSG